jgi:hypothetical protein
MQVIVVGHLLIPHLNLVEERHQFFFVEYHLIIFLAWQLIEQMFHQIWQSMLAANLIGKAENVK